MRMNSIWTFCLPAVTCCAGGPASSSQIEVFANERLATQKGSASGLTHAKPPLKLAVQLLKRMRDVRFRNNKAPAPISIVLTTLAGHFYDGEQSLARTVGEILRCVQAAVKVSHPRLVVLNPTNRDEDFSECWDKDSTGYRVFVDS